MGLREEVIHYLAKRLKQDIRQMESALKCLKARTELVEHKMKTDRNLRHQVDFLSKRLNDMKK